MKFAKQSGDGRIWNKRLNNVDTRESNPRYGPRPSRVPEPEEVKI